MRGGPRLQTLPRRTEGRGATTGRGATRTEGAVEGGHAPWSRRRAPGAERDRGDAAARGGGNQLLLGRQGRRWRARWINTSDPDRRPPRGEQCC